MSYDEKVKINPKKIVQQAKTQDVVLDSSTPLVSTSVFTDVSADKNASGELPSSVFQKTDSPVNQLTVVNTTSSNVFDSKDFFPPIGLIPIGFEPKPISSGPNYDDFASTLKTYYQNSNNDADKTYEYLKSTIKENKDKPENIKKIVNSLLTMEKTKYDDTRSVGQIADTQAEVLQKFLTQQSQIKNAICSTIHGFVMETLNDSNIPAVIDVGKLQGQQQGHATLIYQVEKGKYVWNNYGESTEVQADSIVDASRLIHKQSSEYSSLTNVRLLGKDGQFYQEYEFKDETAFGDDIDKSSHDSKSLFDKQKQESSFNVTSEATSSSVTNRFSFNNFDQVRYDESHQRSLAIENKFSGNTYSFDKSESVGFKLNSSDNYKDFNTEEELIFSTVAGESKTADTDKPIKKTSTNIIEENFGISYRPEIYKKGDLTVAAGVKAFETSNSNLDLNNFAVDARGALETGLQADYKTSDLKLSTNASVGAIADLAVLDYKIQSWGVNYGYKTNFGSSLDYKLNNCFDLSASAEGFYAKTPALQHYGVSGKAEIGYTPNNDTKFYAGVSDEYYKKHLNIGLFDEDIASANTLTTYGGISLKDGLDLLGSYSQNTNQQNKDEKVSFTVKYKY